MRYVSSSLLLFAALVAAPENLVGQGSQTLAVTNYQLVNQTQITRSIYTLVYRADLLNTGLERPALTAIVTSKIASIVVVPGQSNLHFPPVSAGGRVTSTNTFSVTVDRSLPSDFSNLSWNFGAPVANAGPDQNVGINAVVTLDGSKTANPSGIGALTYDWLFASRPPGTRAVLQGADTPMPSFTADTQGDFVLTLRASNGAGTDTSDITVHVGAAAARKPTANAGPGQTVKPGATVTLNGSGSTDPDGLPLTFLWTLTLRPNASLATLTSATSVTPSFLADKPGTYMAQLVVSNGTLSSDPATVTITDVNTRPIANAGPPQNVNAGTAVQLDGSKSTDADGNPLTYRWVINSSPAGSKAVLSNSLIVNPTFVADVAGIYIAQLIVSDGFDDSDASTVNITAGTAPPQKPTANAGPAQSTRHGSLVTLNGSGADPQSKPLTFRWSITTKPAGSTAALSSVSVPNPTFNADLPGTYIAQLIVNNGTLDSDPSTVTISSLNTLPVANAGPNQSVATGSQVTLDGSGSSDAERDPLSYSWSLTSIPPGSTATLAFSTGVNPTFTADVAGTYVAQLIVNDGFGNSPVPATVTIQATSSGVVLTPNPLNLLNAPGTLTATIASPAGTSGQVVRLTSFDTSVATVPASVTIAPGTTSVSFTVTPGGIGITSIFASATGLQGGSATVNVTQPSLTISLSGNSVGVTRSVTGTVTLGAPAPVGGVLVSLTADRSGIVSIPANITIAAGTTAGTFDVTGVGVGSTNISASSPGYLSRSASITVGQLGQITISPSVTVGVGQTAPLPVSLVSAAPTGGVTINLVSSDTNKLTVSASVFIVAGATTPATPAQVTGVNLGSANITASATGFTGDSKAVQVAANLSFTPASLTIGVGGPQNATLTLSGPAPAGGLSVNLVSSNAGAATVPTTVTIPQAGTTVSVPLTGVTAGQSTVITASSSTPGIVSGTLNLNVIAGVVVSTSSLPNGTANSAYSASVAATGGSSPYSFSATGLPPGLSISAAGQITGTPSAPGTFMVAVTVTDSTSPKLTNTANVTFVVNPALAITTSSLPSTVVNSSYTATVAAAGGTAPYTFTAAGLPPGLSISSGGQITGNPTSGGSFTVAVTVTDSTTPKLTAAANLTLTVNSALSITTASLPGGTVTVPYTASLAAAGGNAPYTFSGTGLPPGLTINAAGQIAGTPTAVGSFTVAISVTDSTPGTPLNANASLSITIAPTALALNTTSLPPGTVNSAYSAPLSAVGGTAPYSFSATGLPAGLAISGAGVVSGTPTVAGSFTLSVSVTDSSSPSQSKTSPVTLVIAPSGLTITTTSLPAGTVTAAYSAQIAANGGTPPYNFSATGLPAGLTTSGAGVVSGTPTAAGSFTLSVTVTDSGAPAQTKTSLVTIVIAPPPLTIVTGSLPAGTVNSGYSANVNASGGIQPYTFSATGLPAGLAISTNGQISGTPTTAGTFNPAISVSDSANPSRTASATISIVIQGTVAGPSLTITGGSIGNNLQIPINVALSAASASATQVTVSSDNANVVLGGASQSGASSVNVTVPAGATAFTTFAKGLASSGTATLTAAGSGYNSANATITLTNAGFVVASTNGVGGNFNVNQGASAPLTVSAAALDSSGNVIQIEQLRGGASPAAVTLSNSNPDAGSVSPASLNFTPGTDSLTSQFTASLSSTASTVITASVPAGFSSPSGNSVVATVQRSTVSAASVTVGHGLEVPANVSLQGVAASDLQVVLTSKDPSKVLLSLDGVSAGQSTITTKIGAGRNRTLDFFVYGVGSARTSGYSAVVDTFGNADGVVTIGNTGFILSSPSGLGGDFFTTTQSGPTEIDVFPALLDSQGGPLVTQAVAGGTTVSVGLTSNPGSVGTITGSPVSITGGTDQGIAQFQPVSVGTATLGVTVPAGYANSGRLAILHATVSRPRVVVQNVEILGNNLEVPTNLFLSAPAPAGGLAVTLTSSDASLLQLSTNSTNAGAGTLTVVIPAGQTGASFYLYGKSATGSPSYSAAASGFDSTTATVNLAPSGVIIQGPSGPGYELDTTLAAGPTPIGVSTAVLDPNNGSFLQTQALQGGPSLVVSLTNSNSAVGSITSPVTIAPGTADPTNSTFTPQAVGETTISVSRPLGFSTPSNDTTILVKVQ